jgi:hypothetical protein
MKMNKDCQNKIQKAKEFKPYIYKERLVIAQHGFDYETDGIPNEGLVYADDAIVKELKHFSNR